jgi:sugar phosphate isomerase/epimerase
MLAFSTNWNASRHQEGAAIVAEIHGMGFGTIELGHGLSASLLHGIRESAVREHVSVLSVHNFCPMPVEILQDNPDCYEFTSRKSRERDRALRLTRQTMATAREFEAKFIVLHLGRIDALSGMTDRMLDELKVSGVASKTYNRMKLAEVIRREKAGPLVIERLIRLLEPLVEEAAKSGLVLVAENRSDFEAVPTEREMLALLKEFDSPHLRYWHDFGHAQMRESLGLLDHAQWLEDIAPFAVGAHLQDAAWPDRDHLIPFAGEVDFDRLIPILPKDIPYVLELSPRAKAPDIISAAERWRERFSS